jgi:lipopolysaccharide/colanic/teichoic acid biosynthesis glycosyltransferase
VTPSPETREHPGLPRWVDAGVALAALVVMSPVMLACAMVIALYDGRPVLFRHVRAGRHATPFTLFKFRTMAVTADGPSFTAADDRRVTPVGQLLRRTKLDELPQLWNVLNGDMALVGPRPEALRYVDANAPLWRQVLAVRPGLTDPVTIALRDEQALLERVLDNREEFYLRTLQPFKLRGYVDYLQHRSWRSDIGVLRETVLTILMPARAAAPTLESVKSEATR